ncbi:MAG: hypothetical protein R6X20_09555 [Phycisphaerae bacterium]
MRTIPAAVLAAVLLVLPARAAPTRERWCGRQPKAAHAGTLQVTKRGDLVRLRFDLSALPKDATIHAAWLHLEKEDGQPYEPIRVHTVTAVTDGGVEHDRKRLALEAPWYRQFVATETVRRWVAEPERNLGFAVSPFEGFHPEASSLEILYGGSARNTPPQVGGLRAVHHDGQTFLVWTEHAAYRPRDGEIVWLQTFSENGDVRADGPGQGAFGLPTHPGITLRTLRRLQGLGLRAEPSGFQGIRPLKRVAEVEPVAYRVYRHGERITASTIHEAKRLATVQPLGGYDTEVYTIHFKGEYIDQREEPESFIPTFAPETGRALRPGETLYVHTPDRAGDAYYAVTCVLGGTENLAAVGFANSLAAPVVEAPARPQPVLQYRQEDRYRKEVVEHWYRLWAAPPLVNLPGRSYRIGVAVTDEFQGPGPLEINGISWIFNVREAIRVPKPDRVTLAVERQLVWLPALFYNEGRGTLRAATECKVDYFSERYMEAVIKWVMSNYKIDRSKIHGSLLYFGLRHPEIFPKMSFGTYTATYDYRWAPGSPAHLGPEGIQTVDGEDAWAMYSVGGYVGTYPGRDIPFLICISGTGKDRGHTSEFGWQDDPRGWRALMDARQPFAAAWSGNGRHYPVFARFNAMRWDGPVPAFSRCSLDNHPGNGDPADGDYYGQINGWLLWDDQDWDDAPDRWAMTVFLAASCPRDACTVDLTPRHCRRFRPKPGEGFAWTNTTADGRRVGAGDVTADRWGLVTIEDLAVTKAKHRIVIRRR